MIHYYMCCFSRILLACLSSSAYLLGLNERTPSQKLGIVLNVFLCSQKFAVNRASRALHAVHVKGKKSLVVHRARTPPLPPSTHIIRIM